jgi:glycosyltransferase involved in cell wall biosynthesis
MSVLVVDWLGRGGIAQTTEAWAIELTAGGTEVEVVTRGGRELSGRGVFETPVGGRAAILDHRAVVTAAAERIRLKAPSVVVIQNYVLPPLERPVYDAARSVGARVVTVVHDHRLHTWRAGTRMGLGRQLRAADAVVTHTRFVANGVRSFCGRADAIVVPVPVLVGMLRHQPEPPELPIAAPGSAWAAHVGVIRRAYKGGALVETLAREGVPGWNFLAMGVGAPRGAPGLLGFDGYAPPGVLTSAIDAVDVLLAPYTHATQSGVVVLGHVLGAVPLATAVGGIPEQIDHGIDGELLPAAAPPAAWRDALTRLGDEEYRKELAVAGVERAWREHDVFVHRIRELVS